jgi:hypothetical protein
MAVLIKRSKSSHIPQECIGGCCTVVYGRNVPKLRRSIKRSENAAWKRELVKAR